MNASLILVTRIKLFNVIDPFLGLVVKSYVDVYLSRPSLSFLRVRFNTLIVILHNLDFQSKAGALKCRKERTSLPLQMSGMTIHFYLWNTVLISFQRFGNKFGSAKGAAPYKKEFSMFPPFFASFKNLLEKNQRFVPQVLKQVVNLSCS